MTLGEELALIGVHIGLAAQIWLCLDPLLVTVLLRSLQCGSDVKAPQSHARAKLAKDPPEPFYFPHIHLGFARGSIHF